MYQLEVSGGATTKNLFFQEKNINSDEIYKLYGKKENISVDEFYLVNENGKIQKSNEIISLEEQNYFRACFRITGGKGGFGANLKKAGRKRKVSNFNSCRDLNGRRVRDIIQEQNSVNDPSTQPKPSQAEQKKQKEIEEKKHQKKVEKETRINEQDTKLKEITEKTTNAVQNALKKQKIEKQNKMESKKKSVYKSPFDGEEDSEEEK